MKEHKSTTISCISAISYIAFVFLAYNVSWQSNLSTDGHISNDGIFSPRGDLRVPLVFVNYGETFDSEYIES